MKIEFEGLNFQGYIGKVILDEFNKCKKECEIQLIQSPCPVKLILFDEGDALWYKIKDMKDDLGKKKLYDLLSSYRSDSSFCEAEFGGEEVKFGSGFIIKITSLFIRIYTDRLNDFIINHLDSLDIVIESIKLGVRHEFGHIIDFIHYHGMDTEKFLEIRERLEKEREEFYKSLSDGRILSIDDLERYHHLEEEATANANAGISKDEKIKYDLMLSKINHTELKTTITITSTHEPIKEEENSNGR